MPVQRSGKMAPMALLSAEENWGLSIRAKEQSANALLFARTMIIIAINLACRLEVANVVKAREAGASDAFNSVVRYQKMLLPAHEDDILVLKVILETFLRKDVAHWLKWLEQRLW